MISFKGVTPPPTTPVEGPQPPQLKRNAVEEAPVQAETAQLKNQPEQDTVEFSSK